MLRIVEYNSTTNIIQKLEIKQAVETVAKTQDTTFEIPKLALDFNQLHLLTDTFA